MTSSKLKKTSLWDDDLFNEPLYSSLAAAIGDDSNIFSMEAVSEGPKSDVHISDVIEVIDRDTMERQGPMPYVKIVEQPAPKALRFRYECEGRSAGSIPGINSTPDNKTFPTIKIVGHKGRAVVVVSCVTKESPYKPHPHNLVGREGCERGVCTLRMSSDTISFSNLGIQCVKKKDIEDALKIREEIRVDPYRTGFSHRVQPSNIDLNSVRLCFQVFLESSSPEQFSIPLKPIVSEPIYDKKAMSDLTICKLSDCSASVAGGKGIILLCEKVAKEDIQVRFYEEVDNEITWEALGDFTPSQVHKQVAISFNTPKYRDLDIERAVKLWIQLRRPSDGATSESHPFIFTPVESDISSMYPKRPKRKVPIRNVSSPNNIYQDDDSRSTYVGSLSPDRMLMLQVKPEPSEASPSHFYGGSPIYPGAGVSPGPPATTQHHVYIPNLCAPQQINHRFDTGGGLVTIEPSRPEMTNFNNLSTPGLSGKLPSKSMSSNILDLDTQSFVNGLDSGDLLPFDTDANLSANLSANLRLDSDRPQEQGMTDSFTREARNAIFNDLYPQPPI